MCVCGKEPDSLNAVDCRNRTQKKKKKKKKRAFGFMLTAEELNGVFLGPNRIPML